MTEEKRFGECNQRFITSVGLDNSCGIEDLLKNKKYKGFREQDYHKLTEIREELNSLYYENEQIKQQVQKMHKLIDDKIKQSEEDLNRSVRAGMPTGLMYSEIELLEELKKELNVKRHSKDTIDWER